MYFCNMKYKVSIQESSLTDDFDIFIEISEPFNVSIKRKSNGGLMTNLSLIGNAIFTIFNNSCLSCC
jgi:hypothetical protein